jgi:hypothetical protein
MPTAGRNMNVEKIKNTFEEFKKRDEDRVKDMQQIMIGQGGDISPDVVLMMMIDRLKDLSTLVAVMAKEMIDVEEHPEDDDSWDEARLDIIGQNGPTGLHYDGESND